MYPPSAYVPCERGDRGQKYADFEDDEFVTKMVT
jgi:hypothetical protein